MHSKTAILTYFLLIYSVDAFFSNALKKLKQKSKEAYKKKFGRGKTWHFLGHDLTEYPGTNEKYRQMNKEKWDDYYACLLTQNTSLGTDFSVTPEAIQAIESSSIRLECKMCLSPQETTKLDSVTWFWASSENQKLQPVEYEENILLSPTDKALQIYNLHKKHTGQYSCRIGLAQAAPYFLTVVDSDDENLREVHHPEAPMGPYPEKPSPIGGFNLIVDTEWGPWSGCNKCNEIGRRFRFGYCIVKYTENNEQGNGTEAKISPDDYALLKIFKFGIPCSSHILPRSLKLLSQVTERKNEVMTGFCKTACPEDKVFEVRDKNGNVIERANNSAGIYSVLQGVPPSQPPVERQLVYADKGRDVVIACPGNLNSDAPVEWQIGSKKLIPELLSTESGGRMYISITDKIHIKKVKLADSNIYSCWQHGDLAGTVRLVVEKRISLNFNHHIMLLGMICIFSIFLYVLVKAFLRRKESKAAT